jgi:hypothetical protein
MNSQAIRSHTSKHQRLCQVPSRVREDGSTSTPLLHQPSTSRRMELLIAVGVAALPACYFMFENSDGSIELAVAPQTTADMPPSQPSSISSIPLR